MEHLLSASSLSSISALFLMTISMGLLMLVIWWRFVQGDWHSFIVSRLCLIKSAARLSAQPWYSLLLTTAVVPGIVVYPHRLRKDWTWFKEKWCALSIAWIREGMLITEISEYCRGLIFLIESAFSRWCIFSVSETDLLPNIFFPILPLSLHHTLTIRAGASTISLFLENCLYRKMVLLFRQSSFGTVFQTV